MSIIPFLDLLTLIQKCVSPSLVQILEIADKHEGKKY